MWETLLFSTFLVLAATPVAAQPQEIRACA